MLRRLFVILVGLVAAAWWTRRALARARAGASQRKSGSPESATPGSSESMVRDRVCNTFLPRSRALRLSAGGEEHFFCSERCRDRFLTADSAGS